MKQTEIGLIPDDWEVKTLGDLAFVTKLAGFEFTAHVKYSDLGKIIALRGLNVRKGYLILDDVKYIDGSNFSKLDRSKLFIDDLLFTYVGTVGNAALVDKDDTYYLAPNVALIRCNKHLHSNYLMYLILSKSFFDEQISTLMSTTSQAALSMTNIRLFEILLPPLAEQQRIAKALSDVDALISTTEKLIQKKQNIKQGAMQNLLTGKRRLPGFGPQTKSPAYKQTELGPIPEDWEVKKLSEFGTFSKGSGISREESNTGEYPAVRYGELYTTHNDYIKSFYSHISYEVASKSKKINKGDLLFTCSGETKEDIGKCVAFIGNEKAYAGGDLLILSPTVNIDSLFYGFLLNTTVAIKQKSSMAQGDAVVHISAESIGKIRVPFPSKEEQTAIANVLSSMDKEMETLNTKLEKYRNLKTAMMQQLLTGKIRLK